MFFFNVRFPPPAPASGGYALCYDALIPLRLLLLFLNSKSLVVGGLGLKCGASLTSHFSLLTSLASLSSEITSSNFFFITMA